MIPQNCNHLIQHIKIIFKGFAAAAGIVDHDAFGPQSGQGKTHGHAVVIVGLYSTGTRGAGIDGETVLRLLTADAHAGQFCADGMDTVTFLKTDMSDPPDTGGTVCKRRNGGQSDGLVGTGGHIYGDSMESRAF